MLHHIQLVIYCIQLWTCYVNNRDYHTLVWLETVTFELGTIENHQLLYTRIVGTYVDYVHHLQIDVQLRNCHRTSLCANRAISELHFNWRSFIHSVTLTMQ